MVYVDLKELALSQCIESPCGVVEHRSSCEQETPTPGAFLFARLWYLLRNQRCAIVKPTTVSK